MCPREHRIASQRGDPWGKYAPKTEVWQEPDRRGFSFVTSSQQYEMGEWTASVCRRADGQVVLVVRVVSKPSNRLPSIGAAFARSLQKRAHRLALESFASALREG